MSTSLAHSRSLWIFFGVIFVLLFLQALFPRQVVPYDPEQMAEGDCEGTPISVPYEYTGNVIDPWSCQVQCQDKKQHYLVYTNGIGTQCEPLPGCNDWGEDRGVTCKVPGAALKSPVSQPVSSK